MEELQQGGGEFLVKVKIISTGMMCDRRPDCRCQWSRTEQVLSKLLRGVTRRMMKEARLLKALVLTSGSGTATRRLKWALPQPMG